MAKMATVGAARADEGGAGGAGAIRRRRKTAQQVALRSRIVLHCAEGLTNREVAKQLRIHEATVCKWRGRFVAKRLDGLFDDPRPGAPRKVSEETIERLVTMTL